MGKLLVSILVAVAVVLTACAGAQVAGPCPSADQPIKLSVSKEIVIAAGMLVKSCLQPQDKSLMVKCDQIAIERLVALISQAAEVGK